MNFWKGFLAGMMLVLLTTLTLDACSKHEPAPVAQSVVDVTPNVVVSPSLSIPASTVVTPSAIPKPVAVVGHPKSHASQTDKAAYAKAYANAGHANQLLSEHRYKVSAGDRPS